MASIVYCDRVRHIVDEPRTEIARLIWAAQYGPNLKTCTCGPGEACSDCSPFHGEPAGFIYVTPIATDGQIALKADAITSFQAVPGDGI